MPFDAWSDLRMDKSEAFQRIEDVVVAIPRGALRTYGGVASAAGLRNRSRYVAFVLKHSARDLPWFRVLGACGRIAFPQGSEGFDLQKKLLQAEGHQINAQGKVLNFAAIGAGASLDEMLFGPAVPPTRKRTGKIQARSR
jgi:methylated-DNA-protein-cysteine methyltransferase related protein